MSLYFISCILICIFPFSMVSIYYSLHETCDIQGSVVVTLKRTNGNEPGKQTYLSYPNKINKFACELEGIYTWQMIL